MTKNPHNQYNKYELRIEGIGGVMCYREDGKEGRWVTFHGEIKRSEGGGKVCGGEI